MGTEASPSEVILFIDAVPGPVCTVSKSAASAGAEIVEHALLYNGIQCVAIANAGDYRALTPAVPWFGKYSRPIYVRPLDQEATLRVLQARKAGWRSSTR